MRRFAVIAAGTLVAATVSIGAYYIPFYLQATRHDRDFTSLVAGYEHSREQAYALTAKPRDISRFLVVADSTFVAVQDLRPALAELVRSRRLVRTIGTAPRTTDADYRRLTVQMNADLARLVTPLRDAFGREAEAHANMLASPSTSTLEEAQRVVVDYWGVTRSVQTLRNALAAYETDENRRIFRELDNLLNRELAGINRSRDLLMLVANRKRDAGTQLQGAIATADEANRRLSELSRYAKSSDIASAARHWSAAYAQATSALNIAQSSRGCRTAQERTIAGHLLEQHVSEISAVRTKIGEHRDFLHAQYNRAVQEESTLLGATRRAAGRWTERALQGVRRATESRAGREAGIAVSSLILGARMLFDLTTVGPETDLLSWANTYQADFDRLTRQMEDVERVEGFSPSEFVADLAQQAYELSREPEAPLPGEWRH